MQESVDNRRGTEGGAIAIVSGSVTVRVIDPDVFKKPLASQNKHRLTRLESKLAR